MAVAAVLMCCAANAQALDAKRVAIDIQPQPVLGALKQLGEQTGLQLLMRVDNVSVAGVASHPVSGELTVQTALDRMLADTGLNYEVVNERTVRIVRTADASHATSAPSSQPTPGSTGPLAIAPSSPREMKVAAAGPDAERVEREPASTTKPLEEVLVTAQKQEERLQDVPVPVTAIGADALRNTNQLRLQDYYTRIPGLNIAPVSPYGGTTISIRGLSMGALAATALTTGIVADDVPYSGSGQGLTFVVPEIDPTDIARIEVLRGPQGTLYGANSIGGLLKYVTIQPSTDGFSGDVRTGAVGVRGSDQVGYQAGGAVNVPLSETAAIRASGFTRRDPGFIDDPTHDRKDVNSGRTSSGRIAGLWAPSEAFSVKLSALYQDAKVDGRNQVTLGAGAGDLEQNGLPGAGGLEKKIQLYTAQLSGKIGAADLTSISAYSDVDAQFFNDNNPGGAAIGNGALLNTRFGVTGYLLHQSLLLRKFSEEIRLRMPLGERFEWLLGGFYASDHKRIPTDGTAEDFATGAFAADFFRIFQKTSFEEYSAFTNLTVKFTDRFDVQFGARDGRYKSTFSSDTSGNLFNNVTTIGPELAVKDNSFTYLVTPRFKVSPDLMVYARVASGYRPGGPNSGLAVSSRPKYGPDKTQNYEVGLKGDVFDHALSFDTSVYYIDWTDIQITLRDPSTTFSYVANAGKARSQGVEFSVESRPLNGLRVNAWLAYSDADLPDGFPATASGLFGSPGERLPYNAEWSGSISLDQEIAVSGSATAAFGAAYSYVGDRKGNFRTSATMLRPNFPSYAKLDLRAGMRFGSWDLDMFVNNVTDKRGLLEGADPTITIPDYTIIQPRTIGMTVSMRF
jgi:outer membrane receptor protein involved in Fe transport